MKRFICFVVSVLFITGILSGCSREVRTDSKADTSKINSDVIKGNNQFALDIFKELNNEDGEKSIFISPLSISTALSMTYEGANGATRGAMAKALGYSGMDIKVLNEGYKNLLLHLKEVDSKVELSINNSIWIRQGENIKKDFLDTNKDVFNAYIKELDFSKSGSADEINKWIDKSTKGKIEKMIDSPINPEVIMYLINAIYFKGDWTTKFDAKKTFKSEFNTEDGKTEEAMMMSRKGDIEYGSGDDYKAIRLPYGNKKISMYCILPKEGTAIKDYLKTMNPEKWKKIRESISTKDNVTVQIPRFKLEYGIKELKTSLTKLGMGEAFTSKADFSGIGDKICISRVLHKAIIEVNEEGSEAAGATVVEMERTAVAQPIKFLANRPFLFLIADDETGSILFMGKLSSVN